MFFTGFTKTAKVHKMKATPAKHGGKNGRKVYKIDDQKWTCSCPDFQYRQAAIGGECKHIKAQKAGKPAWEMKKVAMNALKRNLLKTDSKFAKLFNEARSGGLNKVEDAGREYHKYLKAKLPKSRAEILSEPWTPTAHEYKPTLQEMISGRKRYKHQPGTFSAVELGGAGGDKNYGAYDSKNRTNVGSLNTRYMYHKGKRLKVSDDKVRAYPKRQGIATGMYDFAGKMDKSPDSMQTEDAKAFWSKRHS